MRTLLRNLCARVMCTRFMFTLPLPSKRMPHCLNAEPRKGSLQRCTRTSCRHTWLFRICMDTCYSRLTHHPRCTKQADTQRRIKDPTTRKKPLRDEDVAISGRSKLTRHPTDSLNLSTRPSSRQSIRYYIPIYMYICMTTW